MRNALPLPSWRTWLVLAVIAAGTAAILPPAYSDENDHELARQALQAGKVLPLRTVLDQIERSYQGQVIKIEFEEDDGQFVYELRLLHANGEVSELEVDAHNGRVLSMQRKEQD